MSLLDSISSPTDLKPLSTQQLTELAEEIRQKLISSLAQTGGHLGPNLGVVELTLALHKTFESPQDKFIFDVSHQGYIHKLLTGRNHNFDTIRTFEGLNGFLLRTESEHDAYGAGHAGTALSVALGMAVARDKKGSDEHVIAITGDATYTCGPTLEALNNIADSTKKLIVILNDNKWSIDQNVGALSRYFHYLRINRFYTFSRRKASKIIRRIFGKKIHSWLSNIRSSIKQFLLPASFFETLGLRYYGPIDGHDLVGLMDTLEQLKKEEKPVVLHVITEKGRGFQPALDNPQKFHGLGKYCAESGKTEPATSQTYSDIFGLKLASLAKSDSQILGITAAMPSGTKLDYLKADCPEQYFDVGIAEEHAALFACGLATQGFKPFLAIYSTFMQRAYDMIIHDMAIQQLPIRLCLDRAGLSPDDGPTHHGLFDIGYLRVIPNLVMMQPRNASELEGMLEWMSHYEQGPSAIRYPRLAIDEEPKSLKQSIELGKAEIIDQGADIALFGLGPFFAVAQAVKVILEQQGLSISLINPRFIKPLDTNCLMQQAQQCKLIVTLEDHVITGGFGSACIEALQQQNSNASLLTIGWPDEFVEHGALHLLREKHGLTPEAIAAKILAQFNQ